MTHFLAQRQAEWDAAHAAAPDLPMDPRPSWVGLFAGCALVVGVMAMIPAVLFSVIGG